MNLAYEDGMANSLSHEGIVPYEVQKLSCQDETLNKRHMGVIQIPLRTLIIDIH
jgi:hypothetical protein